MNLFEAQKSPIAAAPRIATGTVIPINTQALCQGRLYS